MAFADLSSISYFLPIATYLIVFLIVYAFSKKAELFKGEFMHIFISFLIATVFISAAGPRTYVASIIPWFAILLISFFLLLAMMKFTAGKDDHFTSMGRYFGYILIAFFLISGIIVFSSYFGPYLPWNSGAGADPNILHVTDWIFSPRVLGAILLIGITALISFALVKQAGGSSGGKGKH